MKDALCRSVFVASFVVLFETMIFGWDTVLHSGSVFLGIFLGTMTYQAIKHRFNKNER